MSLVARPVLPPSAGHPAQRRRVPAGMASVVTMWLAVGLVGGTLFTAGLFVSPRSPKVTRANAVVVLAGDFGDRLSKGLELVRAGVAPTLVLDGEPASTAVARMCVNDQPFEVICLHPTPDSTRTEARAAGRLAADRGWRKIVVVTNRSHVTRASLLIGRCVDGDVTMVGTHANYDWRTRLRIIRHEWLGLLDAFVRDRSC